MKKPQGETTKREQKNGERMTYFYILRDGTITAQTATKESAINLIRWYQEDERKNHPYLWANFTIIEGTEEEAIPYK